MHKDLREDVWAGAVDAAARVLDTNWTGRHTVPATGLYPHQWSWDSAFVAIGTRHREPARARAELVALLDAQWADGRVPQIVYDTGRDDDYAPGPDFWRSPTTAARLGTAGGGADAGAAMSEADTGTDTVRLDTSRGSTGAQATAEQATAGLAPSGSAASGPATSGPATSGPAPSGPATSGPATSGPATSGPATSGLVQPPMHAWAAWLVHCADPAGSAREGFLAWVYPRLARWHEYLHVRRAGAVGLPVVKHPWETGTDNSPLWDAALDRVPPEARTAIRRPDLQHAGAGERPGSRDYRRYYRLAETYRDAGCADDVPVGFAMVCPLFATVLAVSELALARISAVLADAGSGQEAPDAHHGEGGHGVEGKHGAEGRHNRGSTHGSRLRDDSGLRDGGGSPAASPDVGGTTPSAARTGAHEATAARVVASLDEHLWDEKLGLYVALDDTTGEPVRRATVNGLVPLLLAGVRASAKTRTGRDVPAFTGPAAPVMGAAQRNVGPATGTAAGRAERLLATLTGPGFLGGGPFLPSTSRDDPAFDPALYWRGPAWFNTSWLLLRAVRALGRDDLAARLREQFALAAREGFPEYVDPNTGAGRGTRQFSWTAALTLDVLLADEPEVLPRP